jgi:hypothetical protein
MEDLQQETFLTRMIAQEKELDERTQKAINFQNTPAFGELSDKEKELLGAQIHAMRVYLFLLRERIKFYKAKNI